MHECGRKYLFVTKYTFLGVKTMFFDVKLRYLHQVIIEIQWQNYIKIENYQSFFWIDATLWGRLFLSLRSRFSSLQFTRHSHLHRGLA